MYNNKPIHLKVKHTRYVDRTRNPAEDHSTAAADHLGDATRMNDDKAASARRGDSE